nr:alpha/beta-hydrolase family protein [Kribbia dieselivorans]
MQYSYLPSAVAFVADWNTPQRVGRELLTRVESMIAQRPAGERPKLYVSGESLGAFGGQAAFSSPQDMLTRVDGAVWIGGPSFTPLWQQVTASRHRASPEVAPVIDSGRQIRFMSQPDDLRRDVYGRVYGGWEFPRVVYLQHPSDPIVWWNPSVVFSEPKWIAEQAGHDVNPRLRWVPVVTFWQLVGDMVVSTDTLSGHGHVYEDEMVPAWNQVLNTHSDRIAQITAAIRNSLP